MTSIAAVPEGSSAYVVNDVASIYLQLKGLVDPAAELAKMEKKFLQIVTMGF